ncbi:MAG: type II toxin-antitoxin system Phd/YefM family antitoxin [Methylophilaceae bacterium]
MMTTITDNDLKTKGIHAIKVALGNQPEAAILVQCVPRYVVMEMARYNHLRECELTAALAESQSA